MTIVGFNFTKMNIEKKAPIQGKINISNNVAIKNIEESPLSFGKTKQKGLKFTFEFNSKYEPKVGEILLTGDVLFIEEANKIDEIISAWKKNKKIPKEVMTPIINTALTKCNIQALILSQQINLPPPIPLPKVKTQK